MGVEFEGQTKSEMMQIRARELQQESVSKLNDIAPIVENIEGVDFQEIALNTMATQDIVQQNLENQTNLDEMYEGIVSISKGITEIKKANTRLSNAIKETQSQLDETQTLLKDIQENMEETND